MSDVEAVVAELTERLHRHRPERYPVQHATASFHLARVLADAGRLDEAQAAAETAASLFADLPLERAKTNNLLGIILRLARRPEDAAAAFEAAERGFEATGDHLERWSAAHNRGLVAIDAGSHSAAIEAFTAARRGFLELGAAAHAGAAARELGQVLLTSGSADEAVAPLEEAVSLLEQSDERPGMGLAANALGLALLSVGEPRRAVEVLQVAVAAHPRSVRPDAHAMAKANLALGLEALGNEARARLAARQARDTPDAPRAAVTQARAVLARLPQAQDAAADLMAVLDGEDQEHWAPLIREEVLRWLDVGGVEPERWAAGILDRPDRDTALAEAWLGVALELPPASMDRLVGALVGSACGLDLDVADRLRKALSSAALRFPPPQWDRLRYTLSQNAVACGLDPSGWG
ncbi:MAG: hypothetical protein KY395_04935 [Actinobacteria bacterium]|nr:hypothetical protein [Actinomycetota bacterium]